MGLDMNIINTDTDEDVAYWRKHWELHYAFENLALRKGLEFDSFNCIEVPLLPGDIEYVENVMEFKDDRTIEYQAYTTGILAQCKFLIGTGAKLSYDSWW